MNRGTDAGGDRHAPGRIKSSPLPATGEYNESRRKQVTESGLSGSGQRRCAVRGREILKTLNERRTEEDRFVRWWRKEEDFLDYDLIDRFVANSTGNEEIGGIELLTMDDMWKLVKKVGGTRVRLLHEKGGDAVEWVHKTGRGIKTDVCTYSPETLMTIFDVETHGNPVDS